jgi:CRISPR-associated endonuclease/helicase Cas3
VPHDVTLALLPDEDGEKELLHLVIGGSRRGETLYVLADHSQCEHLADMLLVGDRIEPWGLTDYMAALTSLASELDLSLSTCARRFGTATVRPNETGWRYHPALGFAQRR